MEDLLVNANDHKLLKRFRKQLEECYGVKIRMPETSSLDSDVVFISIHGDEHNRNCVKKFLSEKNLPTTLPPKSMECKENIELITLSDDEEETTSTINESICILEPSPCSKDSSKLSNPQTVPKDSLDDSVCIIESSISTKETSKIMKSVCNKKSQHQRKRKRSPGNISKNRKIRVKDTLSSSDAGVSQLCEVSSTTDGAAFKDIDNDKSAIVEVDTEVMENDLVNIIPLRTVKKKKMRYQPQRGISVMEGSIPLGNQRIVTIENLCHQPQVGLPFMENFIPLRIQRRTVTNEISCHQLQMGTLVEPVPTPRSLRPIVIDGNNVAIEHGKSFYSARGIQIAIEYFMNRGHKVTAFVPKFRGHEVSAFVPKFRRRYNPNCYFPTDNPKLLKHLAAQNLVVFTPSGIINGRKIVCYDDRFIVQHAAKFGGVIVSNDNYRDLLKEIEVKQKEAIKKNEPLRRIKEAIEELRIKEAIEQRLLMFCFAGDEFMVPEDPLGRNGPTLSDYLSFPSESVRA